MGKETFTQVQDVHRVPYRINPRRNTLRHIIIKLIFFFLTFKATREKQQITYKETLISLSVDFLAETLQGQKGMAYI